MKQVIGLVITAVLATACTDDESTNIAKGVAHVGLEMRATSTQSHIQASARTQEKGLIFQEVLLGVTELEFETDDDNNKDDDDIEFELRYKVDLINGTSAPDFGFANIAPKVYDEIEFEVTGLLDNGASVFIAFDRPGNSGEVTRVEYSSRESFDIEIERNDGFHLDDDRQNSVLILLELDRLFNNIDLSQATTDGDGVVRINAQSNASIAKQIRNNFDDTFEAGDDDDDDDRFDDDDDDQSNDDDNNNDDRDDN